MASAHKDERTQPLAEAEASPGSSNETAAVLDDDPSH
jgi:hypothetical protein